MGTLAWGNGAAHSRTPAEGNGLGKMLGSLAPQNPRGGVTSNGAARLEAWVWHSVGSERVEPQGGEGDSSTELPSWRQPGARLLGDRLGL